MNKLRCSVVILLSFITYSYAATYPPVNMDIMPLSADSDVVYDYAIAAVMTHRTLPCVGCPQAKDRAGRWADFSNPVGVDVSSMILIQPDSTYEVLVDGGEGAIQDLVMSFDGKWIYYTYIHKATEDINSLGSDIYKVNVQTKEIVRLTQQQWAPEVVDIPKTGVYNMHPCPLPDGSLMYVSNRNAYLPVPGSYQQWAWQLTRLYSDGAIETIGHMNLGAALHPIVLTSGEVAFSTSESMGNRRSILWGVWKLWPDGTKWGPVLSAFNGADGWHFCAQTTNKNINCILYYNQSQQGFGTLYSVPTVLPPGAIAFGPASPQDKIRNPLFPTLIDIDRFRFTPHGMSLITQFANAGDRPAAPSISSDPTSPRVGKVTHPAAAPDNNLLVVWSAGPIGGSDGSVRDFMQPQPIHSGIYLIKNTSLIGAPGDMRTVLQIDGYNLQWPVAVVPYARIHAINAPVVLPDTRDKSKDYGFVGTSSLYKRESAPGGIVQGVTGVTVKWDQSNQGAEAWNLTRQGADRGKYKNSDIDSIRIVGFLENIWTSVNTPGMRVNYPPYTQPVTENATVPKPGERLEDWGVFPVRKAVGIVDPDGNPDTSFKIRVPANRAFTFQTLDKDGLVLNMAETWHQVMPGTTENQCGGCHAHSQMPTKIEHTVAGQANYEPFVVESIIMPEWYTHIKPLVDAKCVSCHTTWGDVTRPAKTVIDTDKRVIQRKGVPQGYTDLTQFARPLLGRYSRLMEVLFNKRLDGLTAQESGRATYIPTTPDHTPFVSVAERRQFVDWVELGMTVCLAEDFTSCSKKRP